MNGKKYEIYLSVITIMTVLVTAVGVSFAYFTEIEPGWSATKTFSIEVSPSVVDQVIYIRLDYVNGFKDLELNVNGTVGEGNGINGAKGSVSLVKEMSADSASNTTTLVELTVPASDNTIKYNYTLTASFPDTNQNQNYDQGKTFEATLYADLGESDIYYNDANQGGTTTKPNAQ